MVAYFRTDQKQIEDFIQENHIDRYDYEQEKSIVEFYKSKNPEMKNLHIIYDWNDKTKQHEFFDYYGTNFIRDDPRFLDRHFSRYLPQCLTFIHSYIQTAEDAIEVAESIETFFDEDDRYLSFAEWLRTTSPFCVLYELSF